MDCQNAKELLIRYLDSELDEKSSAAVKSHVEGCPLCRMELDAVRQVDSLLRHHIVREKAPYELRESVLTRLEEKERGLRWWNRVPVQVFASIVFFLVATGIVFQFQKPFPVFAESVDMHMKHLKGTMSLEIISSDPKEVSDWFAAKMDFAVHIPDPSVSGAKLIGARVCHLRELKAAYLMFEKDGQKISMFIVDMEKRNVPASRFFDMGEKRFFVKNVKGYNSILCIIGSKPGMGCVVVSGLPEDKMIGLAV